MADPIFGIRQLTDQEWVEVWALDQTAHEFHQEVLYRENYERYCSWYSELAQQHQQELMAMRGEINILNGFIGLFRRGSSA